MERESCSMEYVKDPLGEEMLLRDGKFQVMMEWEKPYMQACIDALDPFGDVLEIGFGCGYSATHIQTYHPKSHTIIEFHPVVAKCARDWAKDYPNVTIIEDTWQRALSQLGIFDCIFFDDYPLETSKDSSIPRSISYDGSGIEAFLSKLKNDKGCEKSIYRFLTELKDKKQIAQEAYEKAIETIVEEKVERLMNGDAEGPEAISMLEQYQGPERLMQFLSRCIPLHMRKHSRFSCYLNGPLCTWENPHFFQNIIANPDLSYCEKVIRVEVPEHCTYYKKDRALVIIIEKMI